MERSSLEFCTSIMMIIIQYATAPRPEPLFFGMALTRDIGNPCLVRNDPARSGR